MVFFKTYALLAIILCIFLGSCDDGGTNPIDLVTINLVPLEPGNKWNFVRRYLDTLGNVYQVDSDSLYFVGDSLVDGIRWVYRYHSSAKVGYRNTSRGVVIRLLEETTTPGEYLSYPCPGEFGVTYSYPEVWFPIVQMSDSAYTIKLLSRDTTITVPAGTFHCFQYRIEYRVITNPLYVGYSEKFISPDYGWIRIVGFARWRIGGGIYPVNIRDLQTLTLN